MSRAHIVVVNDDPVQLRQIAAVLGSAGHEVSAYLDASDALAGLSGRLEVHLFVVDLHMPGIDGWKLCRLLRSDDFARYNDIPILVVSATFTGSDVESITADLGANAFLEVPFDPPTLLHGVDALLAGGSPRVQQAVLIVEDDPSVRSAVARTFTLFGYEVLETGTLAEARAAWVARPADVVLLDYHLPDGSCEPFLRDLRDPLHRTCVLVMTGDDDPSLPVRLLGEGVDAFLRKPFDPAFAVELAHKAGRQRALLRIESILEARTQELKASELRYRSLFETIPDLVAALDHRGHVTEINPEGLVLLGSTEEELLGRHILELAHPTRTRELSRWLTSVDAGGVSGLETELVGGSGEPVTMEFTGRPVESCGASAVLLVGRDLTERRKADAERRRIEVQMQHTQRLESLGVLAGGVAHDFNNLLVGILGNACLALMDLPERSPARESIHQIEVAARRAAELTQQILAFAGKSKTVVAEFNLPELVREMGKLLDPAVSKKARVRYGFQDDLPTVRGDASQIRQVVMNLIMNASDALGSGAGEISVSTSLKELSPGHRFISVGGRRPEPGHWVSLEVSDTGSGMDTDTVRRIFEPFFTTKFAGRGLGLASTLGVVRAHHGFIGVESTPGRGTKMTVLVPPHGDATRRAADTEQHGVRALCGPGTILFADDEPQIRHLGRAVLMRQGFTVIEAADGAEVLELLEEKRPDAVVMDVSMPGMDGIECLRRIRADHSGLPVLISSGFPPPEIADIGTGGSPTGFLKKPYSPTDLIESLRAVVHGVRPVGEAVAVARASARTFSAAGNVHTE